MFFLEVRLFCRGSDTLFELDLDTDPDDILNPETTDAADASEGGGNGSREIQVLPLCRTSLRVCSLYTDLQTAVYILRDSSLS